VPPSELGEFVSSGGVTVAKQKLNVNNTNGTLTPMLSPDDNALTNSVASLKLLNNNNSTTTSQLRQQQLQHQHSHALGVSIASPPPPSPPTQFYSPTRLNLSATIIDVTAPGSSSNPNSHTPNGSVNGSSLKSRLTPGSNRVERKKKKLPGPQDQRTATRRPTNDFQMSPFPAAVWSDYYALAHISPPDMLDLPQDGPDFDSNNNNNSNGNNNTNAHFLSSSPSFNSRYLSASPQLSSASPTRYRLRSRSSSQSLQASQDGNHIHSSQALISSDYHTDDEKAFFAEEAERKQWQRWAIYAAEVERNRRMAVLAELEEEEKKERVRRQQWAIAAIETERQARIQEHFVEAMASSIWFADTISNINLEYEVVCPYSHLGCRHTCLRTELANHVDNECKFWNLDTVENATSAEGKSA
jgi:hypothetical protein